MECGITCAERDDLAKALKISWDDGTTAQFPYVWLRDNCPEPHTYELSEICKGRKMIMAQLDLSVSPESVELSNNAVIITWPSSLPSRYGSEWLRSRNLFELRVKTARKSLNLDRKILWSAKEFHSKHLRWHKFSQILTDDSKLLECLEDFLKFGLVLMDEVPTQLGQLQLLTKRIGLGYPTHYGSFFSVKSDVNPTNVAYTSGPIGLHVDLPYLQYPPQIQVLHCIEQTEGKGGDSLFADGFHVYEQMKVKEPELARILAETEFEYWDDGATGDFRYKLTQKWPVFNLNRDGQIQHIIYSNQMRSWFYDVHSPEELQSVFKAMKTFDNYLHSDDNLLQFKMKAGQLCMFDNLRVLHGRSGFEGSRLLEGCYFNWDFIKSKVRTLRPHMRNLDQISI